MSSYIQYQSRAVAYTDSGGDGPVLMLLHGFCEDSTMWEEFVEPMDSFRIVCVDLPGFGASKVGVEPTIEYFAEAVKMVVDHLQLSSICLIGYSMGGYVTLAFAERYPELLDGIGRFHSHCYADTEDRQRARQRAIDFILRFGSPLYIKQLIHGLFAPSYSETFIKEKLSFRAIRYPSEGIINALIAMKTRPDRSFILENTPLPVLILSGDSDPVVSSDLHWQMSHLPNIGDLHLLRKCGHMGMFEATKTCQKIVKKFVRYCHERTIEV